MRQDRHAIVAVALLGLALGWPAAAIADPVVEDQAAIDPDFATGRAVIEAKGLAGRHSRALVGGASRHAKRQHQNYLGYAYRHTGQMELAFKHYGRALQLNPRHRGAHEYGGEAYPDAPNDIPVWASADSGTARSEAVGGLLDHSTRRR